MNWDNPAPAGASFQGIGLTGQGTPGTSRSWVQRRSCCIHDLLLSYGPGPG